MSQLEQDNKLLLSAVQEKEVKLAEESERHQHNVEHLKEQIDALQHQLSSKDEDLVETSKKKEQFEMALQKMEESIKIFEGEREFLKTQLSSKTQEQEKLDMERQALSERVSSLQNELKMSQDSLLETAKDQSIISQLKDRVGELEREAQSASEELARAIEINNEATKAGSEQVAKLDSLHEEMTRQRANWQEERSGLEKDILSLQSSLTDAREREKVCLSREKELEEQLLTAAEEVKDLEARLEEIQDSETNREPEVNQKLVQEVTTLRSEREQWMKARGELERERDNIRMECDDRTTQNWRQVDQLISEREELQKRLAQRDEEVAQHQDAMENLRAELKLENEKIVTLTKEKGIQNIAFKHALLVCYL